jgi:oxygen-independent coproporphyrinogen-3 oxidase
VSYSELASDNYIKAVISEFNRVIEYFDDITFDTIYLGGGTPSLLTTNQLIRLVNALIESGRLEKKLEFSIEVNPESSNNFRLYRDIGINRVSIGVQTLNQNILNNLNRLHNSKQAVSAIQNANEFFENINADLMIGLPSQTKADVRHSLLRILPYITHLSVYMLRLSEGTKMMMDIDSEILTPLSDDATIDQYDLIFDKATKLNFNRYEISNFSKGVKYECKHNIKYWNCSESIGLGPGSHSYINNVRYDNPSDIKNYIKNKACSFPSTFECCKPQSVSISLFEAIMLGLRMPVGINIEDINNRFKINFLEKYKSVLKTIDDYVTLKDGRLFIRPEYLTVQNSIVIEFLDY